MITSVNQPAVATLSVSQLNRQVRSLLESHFDYVWVVGEISNFAAPASGHWYFSLKDGSASVRCAMFRTRNQRVRFSPKNGAAVRLRARVSLYEGRGEFQLIVEHLEPEGAGALQAAFDQLKARLLADGLFEQERKQALPAQVHRLGVITSPTGAAIHDILTVLRRRWPGIEVYILPVAVQGDGAAAEICAAITAANRWQQAGKIDLDVLLLARGGGSLEDLWAFNEESVAQAIAASALPVVSAIGHEVDFSIADMVADRRAATPSAAAELLSPDQREWRARLADLELQLKRQLQRRFTAAAQQLAHLRARLKHPGQQLREQSQRLDDLEQRLVLAQQNLLRRQRHTLALHEARLQRHSPLPRLQRLGTELDTLKSRLTRAMGDTLQRADTRVAQLAALLDSVSPLAVMGRGYAIVTDSAGGLITSAAEVVPGTEIIARLAKGRLAATVTGVLTEPEDGGSHDRNDEQQSE